MTTLRNLADRLAKDQVSLPEACREAGEAVTGRTRRILGFSRSQRVRPSTNEVERNLKDLVAYPASFSPGDVEKWSATLVMVHAQIALGNFQAMVSLVLRVLETGTERCPPAGRPLAVAMTDVLLARTADLPEDARCSLEASRARLLGA